MAFPCPLDSRWFSGRNGRMKFSRRDLTVAAVSAFMAVALMAFAQTAAKPVMHSQVFRWAELKATPTKVGERRSVCDAPTPTLANLEMHITTLNPGEAPHANHRHPEEELMIVKDGTVEVLQENRTNIVDAGGIIFQASNELHGLRNVGTNQATYFVIKFVPNDLKK